MDNAGLRLEHSGHKSEDLPAPFWPITAIFIPRRIGKSTSSRIGLLCPYPNDTFSKRITLSSLAIWLPYITPHHFASKWKILAKNVLIFGTIFARWITNEKIV